VSAVGAAALLFLFAPGGAGATSDHGLLQTYQPVTISDPLERFAPTPVQTFVDDANLEQLQSGNWVVVSTDPDLDQLPGPGTGVWRLNQADCSPSMPIGGLACYTGGDAEQHPHSTVYGRVARLAEAIVLQYWYFYYDDVYSYQYPPTDLLWQAHEGDWEVVNVVLSSDELPQYVGYSQHCKGERRSWALTTTLLDTHPIVHVAIGSHANEFAAGTHAINTDCIPQAVIDFLIGHGFPLPVDYAFNGAVRGPAEAGGTETRIKFLDDESPEWIPFPGFWGEGEFFHAPPPFGTFPAGPSPRGPAQHGVWTDPLGTLATWPPG
jgi:hypothetical protein